jgi:hypothetical protein
VNQCVGYRDATVGNWYDTQLSTSFFSAENIRILQNGIRAGVYNKSGGKYSVGDQSCDELKTIMRSIFLQYSRNRAREIPKQIAALNHQVLAYAVPHVCAEAEAYLKYARDASSLATPMSRPVQSNTNDKQLVLKKWF